ncbi:MAG TPA: hypothetical protein VFF60_03460 [Candidatus Binatus sp.]|nr:hypothetical protein [Candidatus Binatus sp.]
MICSLCGMDKTSVVRVQRWIVCHACVIDGVLDRELNPKPQAEAENAGAESHSSYDTHKEPHVA